MNQQCLMVFKSLYLISDTFYKMMKNQRIQPIANMLIFISCLNFAVSLKDRENEHEFINFVDSNEEKSYSGGNIRHLISMVNGDIQQQTARDSLNRLLKDRSSDFQLIVDKTLTESPYEDAFRISYNIYSDKVIIEGTTGVAALFGLNHYLKYYCNALITWEGNNLKLPKSLPKVAYQKSIIDRFRYYQNVCTDSYSFVWWDWPRWVQEIDWMALHGVNMPLAFTGQEEIWTRVYRRLGLSSEDISQYITGPAFLSWWRMGNIQKWGGPLPSTFSNRKLELLKLILERMRNLGMIPVLPAFAGNVPFSITKIFPNVTLISHPSWNGFNASYSTFMLEPTHYLFQEIGRQFMHELINEVGTNHIYSCDTFNENDPRDNSSSFLKATATATYQAMQFVDPKAVWMMQSWVFKSKFWSNDNVEAFLGGIDLGNALILDLEAERQPLYHKFKNFYGHNFLWCMLQNFGGTMNLFGSFAAINEGIFQVRRSVSGDKFLGIGSCPEGINQNSVIFEFLYDMSISLNPVNISQWVENYVVQRYGRETPSLFKSWNILRQGVYNAPANVDNHGRSVIVRRPSLRLTETIWYEPDDIRNVLGEMIVAANDTSILNSELFLHDLVDYTRQFLQLLGAQVYKRIIRNYNLKRIDIFNKNSNYLLNILDDLETILETNDKFLLGPWVKAAESWANNTEEQIILRHNALNQITLWGPSGEIVDYAAKQWAGTIGSYYKPRWISFINALNSSLTSGEPFNYNRFRKVVMKNVEIPFTLCEDLFPTIPKGSSINEARRIFSTWKTLAKRMFKSWR